MSPILPVRVSQILETINHLKPMPANVTRVLHEIDDPQALMPELAGLIGKDQVLAALVLQMANSVALGYSCNCFSLQEAVMRIGLTRLKSIVLVSSSYQNMNRALRGYRLGAGELWLHAQNTGLACENLARFLHDKNLEEAYVSGLLHDIGKLILDQVMLADYSRITVFIAQYKMPLWEIEKKLIGIDHAQVGGLMAERWNLPAELVESIRFHHYPGMAHSNPKLAAIVNLANSITSRQPNPNNGLFSNELAPETLGLLGLETESIEDLSQVILQPLRRAA
jgi:putative nucleotidyltransferase with HDIG domain